VHTLGLSEKHQSLVRHFIPRSEAAYINNELGFFARKLAEHQLWRLFPDFRHQVAYLDIETTGLYFSQDHITTIGLYDGKQVYTYVRGQNLADFAKDISKYSILITFNGKCFDIPFLEYELKIKLAQVHLDLRFILKSLGYAGGLKKCERALGLDRGTLEGVDGYFAVILWQEYVKTGNKKYLDTLLAYNVEDVINLEKLMVIAYNQKINSLPCRALSACLSPLPVDDSVQNPYTADPDIIARLKAGRVYT
jgi:hypothetical protein